MSKTFLAASFVLLASCTSASSGPDGAIGGDGQAAGEKVGPADGGPSGPETGVAAFTDGGQAGTTAIDGTAAVDGESTDAIAGAVTLGQNGNPVNGMASTYGGWLSTGGDAASKLAADRILADNMMTWQLPHGGFYKNDKSVYAAAWNGAASRSGWHGANNVELGTIDNNATVTELMFLADVYQRSGDTQYRDAARHAIDFLLTMQYPSGGFPQVYPARTGTIYSNYVTFNDDAMVRVLAMMNLALKQTTPLAGDLCTSEQLAKMATAVEMAVDYILKAQIVQNGVKTVWCAQHDPTTYEPRGARSYELSSKSGKESVGVVGFLMTQPQTPAIKAAAQAALAWYRSATVKVANTAYVDRATNSTDDSYNPIQTRAGSTLWYRFYDLDQDVGFFSGRLPSDNPPGVGKKYDIMAIEPERRYGYQWGGSYGAALGAYGDSVGY
jgi:PelA/Pel-15E family pectate lyase